MKSQKKQEKTRHQKELEKHGVNTIEGKGSGGKPPRYLMALSGVARHYRPSEADKVRHKGQEQALLNQLAKKRAGLKDQDASQATPRTEPTSTTQ